MSVQSDVKVDVFNRDSYRREIETFLGEVAAGTPTPVDTLGGRQTAYLAEAAGASLRLGRAVEFKTNCQVRWHER